MPLYEYQCPKCGTFEIIQKYSDAHLVVCPTCGSEVTKLFSAPAIQFKGTGWYITDYARKGSGGEAKKADGEAKKAEGAKDAGSGTPASKDSGSKDSGRKDSGTKDSGTKESGAKDSGVSTASDAKAKTSPTTK